MNDISISKKIKKIAVAMSGGVDSSVAAALLVKKYGRENIFGLTMCLFRCESSNIKTKEKVCMNRSGVNDSRNVCRKLGIPHYTVDLSKEFQEIVIKNFILEYQKGYTPNPCILCNKKIKFSYLIGEATKRGANFLATGHYARIFKEKHDSEVDVFKLLKGIDKTKDQSYFLYGLNQRQLAKTFFPLGELKKTEVREIARKYNFQVADKMESQDICFVSEERLDAWLKERVKTSPGKILDVWGNVVGSHKGLVFYTIGQRKGLGGGYDEPMYVVEIKTKQNQVIIGPQIYLFKKRLKFKSANWILGKSPNFPLRCKAKIRYNMSEVDCVVVNKESVEFKKAQRAITPGQSIVFYHKDEVLGGGIIESSN